MQKRFIYSYLVSIALGAILVPSVAAQEENAPKQIATEVWPEVPIRREMYDGMEPPGAVLKSEINPLFDPLKDVSSESGLSGQLIYLARTIPARYNAATDLTFLSINLPSNTSQTYGISSIEGGLFSPQLSPNGKNLLYGDGDRGLREGNNHFFLWDFARKDLRLISDKYLQRVGFSEVLWSPDSNYVTYVKNSNADGTSSGSPLTIVNYNRVEQKNYDVAQDPLLDPYLQNFSWTPRGTLLYVKRPEVPAEVAPKTAPKVVAKKAAPKKPKPVLAKPAPEPPRPAIYEAPAKGGTSKLVVADAYQPVSSPTGEWIACFGWADPKAAPGSPREVSGGTGIFLFHLATGARVPVMNFPGRIPDTRDYPFVRLRWVPDGKSLYLLEMATVIGGANAGQTATVRRFAVPAAPAADGKSDAKLETPPVVATVSGPQVVPLEVSRNGQYLMFKMITKEERGKTVFDYSNTQELRAVRLSDGKAFMVARFESKPKSRTGSWTWHEEIAP